jgi:hypothetical protein
VPAALPGLSNASLAGCSNDQWSAAAIIQRRGLHSQGCHVVNEYLDLRPSTAVHPPRPHEKCVPRAADRPS